MSKVLHLGDIIDGNKTDEQTEADFTAVLETLEPLESPIIHVLGNHCLELGRERTCKALGFKPEVTTANRVVDISPQWRFLVLDSMALSLKMGATEELMAQARHYLETHLDDDNAIYYNGGLGEEQTVWLRSQLEIATENSMNVVVCLHHPVSAKTAPDGLLIWYNEQLQDIFVEFKQCVRAVFSGHSHQGGYAEEDGIHYVVFESILDSADVYGSYGVASFYPDRIEIEGHGDMTSRVLKF